MRPVENLPRGKWLKRSKPKLELVEDTFVSREVDPILDKIAAKGFESLTEKERKILDEARKRMK